MADVPKRKDGAALRRPGDARGWVSPGKINAKPVYHSFDRYVVDPKSRQVFILTQALLDLGFLECDYTGKVLGQARALPSPQRRLEALIEGQSERVRDKVAVGRVPDTETRPMRVKKGASIKVLLELAEDG